VGSRDKEREVRGRTRRIKKKKERYREGQEGQGGKRR
jgi:hypothetical protein